MSRDIVGATMSLDGFINDASGSVAPLYPDFDVLRESAPLQQAIRETGAVLMGRHTFDMAEYPAWPARSIRPGPRPAAWTWPSSAAPTWCANCCEPDWPTCSTWT